MVDGLQPIRGLPRRDRNANQNPLGMPKDTLKKAKNGKPILPSRSKLPLVQPKKNDAGTSLIGIYAIGHLNFPIPPRSDFGNNRVAAAFMDDSGIRFWVKRLAVIYQTPKTT